MPSPQCPRFARRGRPPSARSAPRAASARLSLAVASAAALALVAGCGGDGTGADSFDAERAFDRIEAQVELGERPAGSAASRQLADQLRAELPDGRFEPVPDGLRNIVGTLPGQGPAIVIGAHYDTEAHPPGFVGANDGAAGTAAVVELARVLPDALPDEHREIRFVLFDGEEEPAGCPDTKFQQCALRGSKAYAGAHAGEVSEVLLLDYIANEDVRIPREGNSDARLWDALRAAAERAEKGEAFPGGTVAGVIDDHIPFLEANVPAIDLIDFTYRYADTVEDTPDKLSVESLDAVGETVVELVTELSAS